MTRKLVWFNRIQWLLAVVVMVGCTSQGYQPERYKQQQDAPPLSYEDIEKIPDAEPKIEPLSRSGNKSPYRVVGKDYVVMDSSQGYSREGVGSWYGSKFHGHLTSNGEIYNMFAMSAAHRTLPLPTYLRVTNLNNNRRVIVRVNDRGPFHSDRIIDLSYAAAVKLGFVDQGTAPVRLEAIDPLVWHKTRALVMEPGTEIYLQVGAFSQHDSAAKLKRRLQGVTSDPVSIYLDRTMDPVLHKVQIGPLRDMTTAQAIREKIAALGLGIPIIVSLPRS